MKIFRIFGIKRPTSTSFPCWKKKFWNFSNCTILKNWNLCEKFLGFLIAASIPLVPPFNKEITSSSFFWNFSNYTSKIVLLENWRQWKILEFLIKISFNKETTSLFEIFAIVSSEARLKPMLKVFGIFDRRVSFFVSPFDRSRRILSSSNESKKGTRRNFSMFNSNHAKSFRNFWSPYSFE